jgi:hypothetical protein
MPRLENPANGIAELNVGTRREGRCLVSTQEQQQHRNFMKAVVQGRMNI